MTSATDELRRMLDERGVEWDELVGHPVVVGTEWHDRDGCPCTALEHADDVPDGMLSVQANLTPEQAIEATLGGDLKAENEKLREQIETLVMYVEADGTRYWVDDDGNQHFDQSAVKDDADELRELVRELLTDPDAWDYDYFKYRMRELGVEA